MGTPTQGKAWAVAGGAGGMGTPNTGKELCPWALEGPWAAGPRCTSHPSEGGLCSGAPPAPPRSGHSGPPCSQQQRLPSPRPSSCVGLCGGLEGASALPQDRSFGLGRAGAGRPLSWALGCCPRCSWALASTGGWGPAVCPRLGSVHGWPHLASVSGNPLLKPRPEVPPGAWHCRQGQRWPVTPPRWVWSTCPVPPASQRGRQGHGSKGALSSPGDEGRAGQA